MNMQEYVGYNFENFLQLCKMNHSFKQYRLFEQVNYRLEYKETQKYFYGIKVDAVGNLILCTGDYLYIIHTNALIYVIDMTFTCGSYINNISEISHEQFINELVTFFTE